MRHSDINNDADPLASLSDIEKAAIPKERNSDQDSVLQGARDSITLSLEKEKVNAIPKDAPVLTDWDGPDDPDNPHNWTIVSRAYHATIPGLFGLAVTFGTSVYTPALADITTSLNVSRTTALIGLALYTLGLGFGPIISAPLSENHGRKIVYLVSAPIFMLFTLGAGLSKSLASLLVCRFFAGVTGSPALAVGAGTNADLFPPQQRAVVTSAFLMAPFLGPSLGPIVGGFAAQYKGWRWTQWCMLFLSIPVFLSALLVKETYKPAILKRRAKGHNVVVSTTKGKDVRTSVLQNFLRPLHMLFTEPVVFFLSLYTSFAFAVLFLFFAAFPFVFAGTPYHFTASQTGLTFLGIGTGVLLAGTTGILVDRKIYQAQYQKAIAKGNAHARPEHRLYNAMIGSLGIPVGLFWFGWTADKGCHWALPVMASVPFAWGNLCLFNSAVLYMVDVYGPRNGASALAANGILRYALGAVFPLFTVQMYEALGTGWATSLLGFLSVLMLPIPWIFYRWGPAIRKRSRYPVMM